MNHKKLVQIKKNWEFRKDVRGHIEGVDVDWLIEQAEKVEQLEKENMLLYGKLNNIIALAKEKF